MCIQASWPAAALIALALAVALGVAFPIAAPHALADDKGKSTEKAQPKEVPAQCARLIKASERRRCLQKSGG